MAPIDGRQHGEPRSHQQRTKAFRHQAGKGQNKTKPGDRANVEHDTRGREWCPSSNHQEAAAGQADRQTEN
jgi:hypothetical protein